MHVFPYLCTRQGWSRLLTHLSAKWEQGHVLPSCISHVLQWVSRLALQPLHVNRPSRAVERAPGWGHNLHLRGIYVHNILWGDNCPPWGQVESFFLLEPLHHQIYPVMPIARGSCQESLDQRESRSAHLVGEQERIAPWEASGYPHGSSRQLWPLH